MPIPKKRIIIDKDHGIRTEDIPRKVQRDPIFVKKGKSIGVMKYLKKRATIQRKKLTQRQRDLKLRQARKHLITKGSIWRFRRLENLVKNRHSVKYKK